MSATNLVLANLSVFLVGQPDGAADPAAAAVAVAALTAEPVAATAAGALLLELHATLNASGAATRITDNFRNIQYPPD
jgi:hypothetical protein